MSKALVLGAAALVLSATSALADGSADIGTTCRGIRSAGTTTRLLGTACLCSPGLYSTASLRGAGPCLRSSIGPPLLRSPRGFAAARRFAPNICLCTRLLGRLRAWVAWVARLRSPVVALNTLTRMAGRR